MIIEVDDNDYSAPIALESDIGSFLPDGEGAVSRTFQTKLREVAVSVNDYESFEQAAAFCVQNDRVLDVPDGIYKSDADITIDGALKMRLSQGAYLDLWLIIQGKKFAYSTSVGLSGTWTDFPVGTTNFSGDFSGFSVGDVVAVSLSDGDGGSQSYNEAGIDFATVTAVSESSLTISGGTRLSYRSPTIYRLSSAVQYIGTLERDAYYISGDYTALFSVDDIVRVENTQGTDGVEASAYYFELVKIISIDSSGVTLKSRMTHAHINPWLVRTGSISGVSITGGGRIKKLQVSNADSVNIDQTGVDRQIMSMIYDSSVTNSVRTGLSEPSTSNMTWCFGRNTVSNVRSGGTVSYTDNAAFKVMGCQNLQMSNIVTDNSTSMTTQGSYGVFVDGYYTPYRIWNNGLSVSGIAVETPRGGSGRGAWFYGVRGGRISSVGGAAIFIQGCQDSLFDVSIPYHMLEVKDLVRCDVRGSCKNSRIYGCIDTQFDISTRDTGGAASNRCVWFAAGSVNPETGISYTIGSGNKIDVVNYSNNKSDTTIYFQSQTALTIGSKCRDVSGLNASVVLGPQISAPLYYEPNNLNNSVQISALWVSTRVVGYLHADGGYNVGGLLMGGNYIWVNSGTLRISSARPTSGSDGSAIGP